MIYDSSYWKDDLIKLANKLERRLIQTRWGDKNFYTVEKEIFLGFYSIRKLIEAGKISDSLKSKNYKLKAFPYLNTQESIIVRFKESEYDFSNADTCNLTVLQLCNQFIHSHHFVPVLPNGKNLVGFFFCSDHKRKTYLYFITLFDVVDIYRAVGNDYPSSMYIERLPNGETLTKID